MDEQFYVSPHELDPARIDLAERPPLIFVDDPSLLFTAQGKWSKNGIARLLLELQKLLVESPMWRPEFLDVHVVTGHSFQTHFESGDPLWLEASQDLETTPLTVSHLSGDGMYTSPTHQHTEQPTGTHIRIVVYYREHLEALAHGESGARHLARRWHGLLAALEAGFQDDLPPLKYGAVRLLHLFEDGIPQLGDVPETDHPAPHVAVFINRRKTRMFTINRRTG